VVNRSRYKQDHRADLDVDVQAFLGMPELLSSYDAAALWRGAFLTAGGIDVDGCNPGVVLTCPSAEVAMALVDVARCLGVPARSKNRAGSSESWCAMRRVFAGC